MKEEISAGGAVYRKDTNTNSLLFLLIKDSYGRWALPKGKLEKDETPQEAAKREIGEEVGIYDLRIKENLGQIEYSFKFKNQSIYKKVHFFLMETNQEKCTSNYEIKGFKWFLPNEAIKTIAYDNTRAILKKAVEVLKGEQNNDSR